MGSVFSLRVQIAFSTLSSVATRSLWATKVVPIENVSSGSGYLCLYNLDDLAVRYLVFLDLCNVCELLLASRSAITNDVWILLHL